MTEIRARKKKLEDDLELLEGNFESRISKVQGKVFGSLKPVSYIKKNPFKAVGSAIFIGFAIGLIGKKSSSSDENGSKSDGEFSRFFLDEVKRIAARRAATYISDFIDQRLSQEK